MTLDISRIRALCFDVDGTLRDTDDQWVSHLEGILSPIRRIISAPRLHSFCHWFVMGIETPGNLMYSWLDWMHLDDDLARIYNALSKLRKKQRPGNYWLIPGVPEMLAILHKHYLLAIVSARDSTSTLAFLDHFNLRSFFPVIATSQTCTHTKPYADPILWAASQLGVAPEACLMIGDTTVDIKAGKFAGAQTLGVLCGFGSEKEILRAGADHILPSTRDLPTLLLQPEQAAQ